jgi:hypothetical protein
MAQRDMSQFPHWPCPSTREGTCVKPSCSFCPGWPNNGDFWGPKDSRSRSTTSTAVTGAGRTRWAELLKLEPLVHAKPGWVNRDCSVVGLERDLIPHSVAHLLVHRLRRHRLPPPPRSAPIILSFCLSFPAACFALFHHSVVFVWFESFPVPVILYHALSLRIVMSLHCFISGGATWRHRGPAHAPSP